MYCRVQPAGSFSPIPRSAWGSPFTVRVGVTCILSSTRVREPPSLWMRGAQRKALPGDSRPCGSGAQVSSGSGLTLGDPFAGRRSACTGSWGAESWPSLPRMLFHGHRGHGQRPPFHRRVEKGDLTIHAAACDFSFKRLFGTRQRDFGGATKSDVRCCGLEEGPRVELAGRECPVLLLTSPRGAEQTGAAAAG